MEEFEDCFHAVILDAGSTGSRAFVYQVVPTLGDDDNPLQEGRVIELVRNDVDTESDDGKGIHEAKNQEDVEAHLSTVFNAVNKILQGQDLPRKVYVLATGGVRDNLDHQGRETLRGLLEEYFETNVEGDVEYGLPISGTDEAKFGWVAAHYSERLLDFDGGYVEMGGATAQIAFPVDAGSRTKARGVVKKLNLEKVLEMVHDDDRTKLARIRRERKQRRNEEAEDGEDGEDEEDEEDEEVVKLWNKDEKEWVKGWEGDIGDFEQKVTGANLEGLAERWECTLERLGAVKEGENKAVLEGIGEQEVFLASYPLGVKRGYEAYKDVLPESEGRGITEGNTYYDPSRRNGYKSDSPDRKGRIIIGGQTDHITLVNETPQKQRRQRHILTFNLIGQALDTLFSEENQDASYLLHPVLRKLPFFGASNFWHHMKPDDPTREFSVNKFFARLSARANLSHSVFHYKYIVTQDDKDEGRHPDEEVTPPFLIEVRDNEIFLARWALKTLVDAFDLNMESKKPANMGDEQHEAEVPQDLGIGLQRFKFTPYDGPDRRRFSWTLGKAVLLASKNLRNLTEPDA